MNIKEITDIINKSGVEIKLMEKPSRTHCNLLLKIACEHLRLLKKLEAEKDDGH